MYRPCRTWRLIGCAPLALGAALFAGAQTGSSQPRGDGRSQSIAIRDVTVIDVATGGLRNGVTVVTQGERIAEIGPRPTHSRRRHPSERKREVSDSRSLGHAFPPPGNRSRLFGFVHRQRSGGDSRYGQDIDFILPLRE